MLQGWLGGDVGYAVTDRLGPGGRAVGAAASETYGHFNLGDHVGDDADRVIANRRALQAALGPDGVDGIVWMRQVHGNDVVVVDGVPAEVPECDGLVTTTPGLALAAMAADCVPVMLADPVAGVVGVAHAGRLGLQRGVVDAVLSRMTSLGALVARTSVVLGPSICGRCYEVPAQMRDEVAAAAPSACAVTRLGTPGLDLRSGLVGQWVGRVADIHLVGGCTREDPSLYSFRREPRTGRLAGLIWRAPEEAA